MDKLWYLHAMEYYTAMRKETIDICNNIDESHTPNFEWKKPDTKDSNNTKFRRRQN